jgi:hypothetical protein
MTPPTGAARAIDEILTGDALAWLNLTPEQLRTEHELLRRSLETARGQIALWSPLVAWLHKVEQENAALVAEVSRLRELLVEVCDLAIEAWGEPHVRARLRTIRQSAGLEKP